jgi:hypothetical protein
MLVWWGSTVECVSALARREREGSLDHELATFAFQRLQRLASHWGGPSVGSLAHRSRFRAVRRGEIAVALHRDACLMELRAHWWPRIPRCALQNAQGWLRTKVRAPLSFTTHRDAIMLDGVQRITI